MFNELIDNRNTEEKKLLIGWNVTRINVYKLSKKRSSNWSSVGFNNSKTGQKESFWQQKLWFLTWRELLCRQVMTAGEGGFVWQRGFKNHQQVRRREVFEKYVPTGTRHWRPFSFLSCSRPGLNQIVLSSLECKSLPASYSKTPSTQ